jgi:hypothetical protein
MQLGLLLLGSGLGPTISKMKMIEGRASLHAHDRAGTQINVASFQLFRLVELPKPPLRALIGSRSTDELSCKSASCCLGGKPVSG